MKTYLEMCTEAVERRFPCTCTPEVYDADCSQRGIVPDPNGFELEAEDDVERDRRG
jgi:hypothetical protein